MSTVKISVSDKSAMQIEQLALALKKKKADVVDMAMDLLWRSKADDVKRFLGSIDDGSALFNGVETDREHELVVRITEPFDTNDQLAQPES